MKYMNLIYSISYKISTDLKTLCIRFDKIDGLIRALDGEIKHLVLFHLGLFDKNCYISYK